jgi:TMEM175 potassium channel family protein
MNFIRDFLSRNKYDRESLKSLIVCPGVRTKKGLTGIDKPDETLRNIGFGKNRIEALTDGIFAFSMTLLVTSIDIPKDVEALTPNKVLLVIQGIFPDLIHYIIAFLVIAVFWYIHHVQFHRLVSVDLRLLWTNILMLLFVALIPFSTSLVGDFPATPLAQIIFEFNMMITGLLLFWQWTYASKYHHLIDPTTTKEVILIGKQRALVVPLLSVIGIGFSLLHLPWSTFVYFFSPVLLMMLYLKEVKQGTVKIPD